MALIPPQYLNAVVSIELDQIINNKSEKVSIATGFLFGKFINKNIENNQTYYSIYLITNRHVFENRKTKQLLKNVYLRFNLTENKGAKHYQINLLDNNKPVWIKHNNEIVDIAVIPLNGKKLKEENIEFYFFREDSDVFLSKDFENIGVSTGDGIFVLGFPNGIRGKTRNFSIVKKGIIARYDEELLKEAHYFIDSSAYPGNSGGPIVYKPELVAIQNTKPVSRSALIGIISEGITYREIAVSEQTGNPRIAFEEQTGIVKVVPIDFVIEAINQYEKEKGAPKTKEKLDNIENQK